jgi:apolipoprotein N-acyltransferase
VGGRFVLGTLAGLVWAGCMVGFWLYPAARIHLATGPFAAAALTAAAAWTYGGLYLAAFAVVYSWLPRPRWLAAPAVWVLLEQARTVFLGGAPWGLLGHTQHAFLPLAQLAEWAGVSGLSFLVLLPAASLAESEGRERLRGLGVATAAVGLAVVYGVIRLATFSSAVSSDAGPSIHVIGGENASSDPLERYLAATSAAGPATLTVWPEAAISGYLQEDPRAQAAVAAASRAHGWLLLGTPRYEGRGRDRRYFNSAVLFDPAGSARATYDKRLLVPFAEYEPLPLPRIVARPFSAGAPAAPLDAGGLRLGPLICWEAIFPEPARWYARAGVDVLVNLSSDRDVGAGAAQQLAFSRFRAIETRRWLVRASGNGPPILVDPTGRIHADATLHLHPGAPTPATFYVRHASVVPLGSAALLAVLCVRARRERGDAPRREPSGAVGSC